MTPSPDRPDDDLTASIRDAVSDVRPSPGLADIRRRTAPRAGRPRTWLGVAAAAAMVAGIVGVIAVVVRTTPPDQVTLGVGHPTAIPTDAPTSGSAEPRTVTTTVSFVGDAVAGPRLFQELRTYAGVAGWSDLRVAVVASVIGDTTDPDYRSAFPTGTSATATATSTGTVDVDLSGDPTALATAPADGSGPTGVQAVVQTVATVLGRPTPVRFTINGSPADTVLGVDTVQPVSPADPDSVMAPVLVTSPGNQTDVSSPFTVTGRAATFEANVQWELISGTTTIRRGYNTAQECCTLAPYSFEVTAPPGRYTLVVHDSDESGAGRPVNQDTKTIVVR